MAKYRAYAVTDTGRVRPNNEDNFFCNGTYKTAVSLSEYTLEDIGNLEELSVFAVFDGMGGMDYGEAASLLLAEKLYDYVAEVSINQACFSGEEVITKMNQSLCREMKKRRTTMGSTAVILSCQKEEIQIANVGDSRAYLLRENTLTQLSVDHTERNSMLELQKELGLSEEMELLGVKDALTQHLGIEEDEFLLEPYISEKIKVFQGDIFLLCSDGLSGMVSDEKIQEILKKEKDISRRAERLLENALQAGGEDNITFILFEI